jgi:hypothetical protein
MTGTEPSAVDAYDAELVARSRGVLGDELAAVYAAGSWALGDYVPGRSDLDRLVVSAEPLRDGQAGALVEALRHEALPVPARKLELVVYARAAVERPTPGAAFELNLNTGEGRPHHATTNPEAEPGHWFVLDRAIARERGIALVGPPALTLFAPLPRQWLRAALRESLAWHAANPEVAEPENTVLNACRAWFFLVEGRWASKDEAAEWALEREPGLGLVRDAVALRRGEGAGPLDAAAVGELAARVSVLA